MRRLVRLIVAVGLLLAPALSPPVAAAAERTTGTTGDFSEIAGCISGAENLLVAMVVDESLSLRSTDPRSLRVQGITTAVDSLEQLAQTADTSMNIELTLSTFARGYRPLVPWRSLTGKTARQIRTTAEQSLPGRDAGDATDYRRALLGAKKQLDARQRQLDDPDACKLMLWFTDGALDVDDQTDAARRELCQAQGIIDAVRDDGIGVVALALLTPGSDVTPNQRAELRALAEGTAGSSTCGTIPIPSDSTRGVFLPADDPTALQQLFAGAGALISGGTEVGSVDCPGPHCDNGDYALDVDPGVAGARVLIQSDTEPEVTLTTPSGEVLRLRHGATRRIDGATVDYVVRGRMATLNLDFDPYTEVRSRWAISPDAPSRLSSYWFWGAQLAPQTPEVRAGEPAELAFQLRDRVGRPLPTDLFRTVRASISVDGQEIPTQVTPSGKLVGRADLDVDEVTAALAVSATVSAVTAPGRVPLGPISRSARIPVTLPAAFPSVAPSELDLGELEGVGTATGSLRLTGSRLGPTRVCLRGSSVTVPGAQPSGSLVSTPSECVDLGQDETATMRIDMTPSTSADGVATGQLDLRLTGADDAGTVDLAVPASLEMQRPVDEVRRWGFVAVLLALALLVPLLMLLGSNVLLGRFAMAATSRTASKPVRVTPSGVQLLNGSAAPDSEDFENAGFSGTRRGARMTVGRTGVSLRVRRILSLRAPVGVATAAGRSLLVSRQPPHRGDEDHEAPVALGEVDAAFVLVDTQGATAQEASGTLVLSIPAAVDGKGVRDRIDQVNAAVDWSQILTDIAGRDSVVTTPASARRPTHASPGDGAPDDDEFPLPAWAQDSSSDQSPGQHRPPADLRRGKARSSPPPTRPSAGSSDADDDNLPPLPDFLN